MAQTLLVCMSNLLHRLVCEWALSGLTVCKLPEREFFLDSLGNLGISPPWVQSRAQRAGIQWRLWARPSASPASSQPPPSTTVRLTPYSQSVQHIASGPRSPTASDAIKDPRLTVSFHFLTLLGTRVGQRRVSAESSNTLLFTCCTEQSIRAIHELKTKNNTLGVIFKTQGTSHRKISRQ